MPSVTAHETVDALYGRPEPILSYVLANDFSRGCRNFLLAIPIVVGCITAFIAVVTALAARPTVVGLGAALAVVTALMAAGYIHYASLILRELPRAKRLGIHWLRRYLALASLVPLPITGFVAVSSWPFSSLSNSYLLLRTASDIVVLRRAPTMLVPGFSKC